jgi:hypothetical protein
MKIARANKTRTATLKIFSKIIETPFLVVEIISMHL